jgi:hypothetical protein
VTDDPLPLRILELRAQITELSGTIRQLQRSRLDDAEVRRRATLEGYRYHHVQAIIVAIDQYAEAALGNREYFLNKPHRIG